MKQFNHLINVKNKKVMIGLSAAGLVLTGLGLSITTVVAQKIEPSQKSQPMQIIEAEAKQSDVFEEKINGVLALIDKRLSRVQEDMGKVAFKNKDEVSTKALHELSQTVMAFKEEAARSLIKNHEENEILAKKIQTLQEVIAAHKSKDKAIEYLDKKALPFEVLAIDSVNEEAVLALRYNYNQVALEQGDKLAGWKIINLNYAKQQVEFADEKGAHIKLSLAEKAAEAHSWA